MEFMVRRLLTVLVLLAMLNACAPGDIERNCPPFSGWVNPHGENKALAVDFLEEVADGVLCGCG